MSDVFTLTRRPSWSTLMLRCLSWAGSGWPAPSSRRAGPWLGPRNGSRFRGPRLHGGRAGIETTGRPGWSTGPHGRTTARTRPPAPVVRRIVHHRTKKRLGPVQIAPLVGVAPSTVHRVLTRCGLQRLAWLDRATGVPVRYEYPDPGGLVHVDVKKLGNIPAGGGWKMLGRTVGNHNHKADKSSGRRTKHTVTYAATPTSTPRLTTIPAWPTARSTTTKPARQPLDSGAGPTPGSPTTASQSNES